MRASLVLLLACSDQGSLGAYAQLVASIPADGSTNIDPAITVRLLFSAPLEADEDVHVDGVTGRVHIDGPIATFTPDAPLATATSYVVSALGQQVTFTTAAHRTGPQVASITPANGATDVTTATPIRIAFTHAMNAASLEAVTVSAPAERVYADGVMTLTPQPVWPAFAMVQVDVPASLQTVDGVHLVAGASAAFQTGRPEPIRINGDGRGRRFGRAIAYDAAGFGLAVWSVATGDDDGSCNASVFDPASATWSEQLELDFAQCVVMQPLASGFLLAGSVYGDDELTIVQRYDPSTRALAGPRLEHRASYTGIVPPATHGDAAVVAWWSTEHTQQAARLYASRYGNGAFEPAVRLASSASIRYSAAAAGAAYQAVAWTQDDAVYVATRGVSGATWATGMPVVVTGPTIALAATTDRVVLSWVASTQIWGMTFDGTWSAPNVLGADAEERPVVAANGASAVVAWRTSTGVFAAIWNGSMWGNAAALGMAGRSSLVAAAWRDGFIVLASDEEGTAVSRAYSGGAWEPERVAGPGYAVFGGGHALLSTREEMTHVVLDTKWSAGPALTDVAPLASAMDASAVALADGTPLFFYVQDDGDDRRLFAAPGGVLGMPDEGEYVATGFDAGAIVGLSSASGVQTRIYEGQWRAPHVHATEVDSEMAVLGDGQGAFVFWSSGFGGRAAHYDGSAWGDAELVSSDASHDVLGAARFGPAAAVALAEHNSVRIAHGRNNSWTLTDARPLGYDTRVAGTAVSVALGTLIAGAWHVYETTDGTSLDDTVLLEGLGFARMAMTTDGIRYASLANSQRGLFAVVHGEPPVLLSEQPLGYQQATLVVQNGAFVATWVSGADFFQSRNSAAIWTPPARIYRRPSLMRLPTPFGEGLFWLELVESRRPLRELYYLPRM